MKATVERTLEGTVKLVLKQNYELNLDRFSEHLETIDIVEEVTNPSDTSEQAVFFHLLINFLLLDPTISYLDTGNYCQDTGLLLGFNFEENGDFFKVSFIREDEIWYLIVTNKGITTTCDLLKVFYLSNNDNKVDYEKYEEYYEDYYKSKLKIKAFWKILFKFCINYHNK